ncbi:uncharacterized protein B0H64DRAFT_44692 [Chaetomium fimeti]|uniref:Uncharacterized protein n=1 Tax=Chaetomium fimeti TaxID=1854472 RepID=A0AAE0LNB7_9PEZI|nr:hypothetical protein B0H64DRAFT_44692 [Chaetomium fimeti]
MAPVYTTLLQPLPGERSHSPPSGPIAFHNMLDFCLRTHYVVARPRSFGNHTSSKIYIFSLRWQPTQNSMLAKSTDNPSYLSANNMNAQTESQADGSEPSTPTDIPLVELRVSPAPPSYGAIAITNTEIANDAPDTNDLAATSDRGNAGGPLPGLLDILLLENCGCNIERDGRNYHSRGCELRLGLICLALYVATTATLVVMVWAMGNKT